MTGAMLLAAVPATAWAQARPYNIPSQPLADALREYGRTSGHHLLFTEDLVRGKTAPRLNGRYEPDEALARLLSGSGLRAERAANGTIMIVRGADGQTPPGEGEAGGAAADSEGAEQTVVVTGTNIRGVQPETSPLYVYDRTDIARTGAGSTAEFIRYIPQNFAQVGQETTINNGADPQANANAFAGASLNLRGLGPASTLVLLNGRRLAPSGSDGSLIDVSLIPISAIERVEVLPDGASAIYGADAVAGVVNFVLRRNLDGLESSARWGAATRGGAEEFVASQLAGKSWADGNVMLVYEYGHQEPLFASDRDFIPPQAGAVTIVPKEDRHSVILAGRHRLAPSFELFGQALFSQRDFEQTQTTSFTFAESNGRAEQLGLVLGATVDFAAEWSGEIVANLSETRGRLNTRDEIPGFGVFETETRDRTEIRALDLTINGTLASLPAGPVRVAFGATARQEEFSISSAADDVSRDVVGIFGELLVPIVSPHNAVPLVHRLELSLAGRYDDYSDVGSSGFNPKVGILWSPVRGLKLRGSYGESFRAPLLNQLDESAETFFVLPLPNPTDPNGVINTIFPTTSGNARLQPERSEALTLGFDFNPSLRTSLVLSGTYYEVRYTGRIARPPLVGTIFDLYSQLDTLGSFVNLSPDPALIQGIYSGGGLNNPFGIPQGAVEAFYDARLQNLASTRTSGLDLSLQDSFELGSGTLALFLSGNYIFELETRPVATVAPVQQVDVVFSPTDFRARGGLNWTRGGLSVGAAVNYYDGYSNPLVTPAQSVDSWTTLDAQLGYSFPLAGGSPLLRGLRLSLIVQNLTDEDPPVIEVPPQTQTFLLGYDATNASARGRFVALSLSKPW